MSTERYADRMARIHRQTAAGFHVPREDAEFLLSVIDALNEPPLTTEQAEYAMDAVENAKPLSDERIEQMLAYVRERIANPHRVSVDEVRRLHARLAEFNAMPFDEIVWVDDADRPIELTPEQLEATRGWRFVGLTNACFVEAVINDPPTIGLTAIAGHREPSSETH